MTWKWHQANSAGDVPPPRSSHSVVAVQVRVIKLHFWRGMYCRRAHACSSLLSCSTRSFFSAHGCCVSRARCHPDGQLICLICYRLRLQQCSSSRGHAWTVAVPQHAGATLCHDPQRHVQFWSPCRGVYTCSAGSRCRARRCRMMCSAMTSATTHGAECRWEPACEKLHPAKPLAALVPLCVGQVQVTGVGGAPRVPVQGGLP